MKRLVGFLTISVTLVLLWVATAYAVPACPNPISFTQPNGSVIEVTQHGDEFLSWVEDSEGYLVLFDEAKDGFTYAVWTEFGQESTGELIGETSLFRRSTQRDLGSDIPPALLNNAMLLQEEAMPDLGITLTEPTPSISGAPTVNSVANLRRNLLIIYVRWGNESNIPLAPLTGKNIHDLVFNASTKSVNNYYRELFGASQDIIVPAAVTNPMGGYQGIIQVTISGSHTNPGNDSTKRYNLVHSAILAADPYINFANYDTNKNGIIEASELSIGVIIHGYETSYDSSTTPSFWGSAFWDRNFGSRDGKWIRNAFGQGAYQGSDPLTIGVICHELGHSAYSFLDTYDYGADIPDGTSAGQGYWSLMAQGSWGRQGSERKGTTPSYVDAYNLVTCNVVAPEIIFQTTSANIRLNTHLDVYKVTSTNSRQYFLLQQRKYGTLNNYDRGALFPIGGYNSSVGGLLIYHVDEAVSINRINDKNTHMRAGIEEAHGGTQHMQQTSRNGINDGDIGDLWGYHTTSGKNAFLATSDPSSRLYSRFVADAYPPSHSEWSGVAISGIVWDSVVGCTMLNQTIDITNDGFTDPNFRAAVYALIGKTLPAPILASDVERITSLDVSNMNIQSLTGLENFASLTTLRCSGNQLSSLPNLPTGLRRLYCYDNLLTSLPNLPTGLSSLYCYDNLLTSLPTLPPDLTELDCSSNQLASLPNMTRKLTHFNCSNNRLTSLRAFPARPIDYFGDGLWLDCSNNQLTSLPALPDYLIGLDCSYNRLNSLPTLPQPLYIQWLYLARILPIWQIENRVSYFSYLDCSNNQLTSLPTIPSGGVTVGNNLMYAYLETIKCDNNRLTTLPTLPYGLQYLSCQDNQLTSLPALPSRLRDLFCSNNQLPTLPMLPSGLEKLRCDNNHLTSLNVIGLTTLSALNCSYNDMANESEVIGFTGNWGVNFIFSPQRSNIAASLIDMNFRAAVYNAIGKTAPEPIFNQDVESIIALDLSGSDIQSLAGIQHFIGLQILDCSNNQLTSLDVTGLQKLYFLNCSRNNMDNASAVIGIGESDVSFVFQPQNPQSGSIAITNDFSDLNFRAAVLNAVGRDENEEIFDTDIACVTTLNVSARDIKSLEGLGHFTSLAMLYCGDNHLTSMPELPATLEYISCENNQLTLLSSLPSKLTMLYCYNNQLTSLDLTGLAALEYVDCTYNDLTDESVVIGFTGTDDNIAFYPQNHQAYLSAITDDITDSNFRAVVYRLIGKTEGMPIYASDVSEILALNVSYKGIQNLSGIQHFKNLSDLSCSGNILTSLPTLPSGLINLDCSNNKLKSLPMLPDRLALLDCADNQLSFLPALPNTLTDLLCENNLLTSLPMLPFDLTWLSCQNNNLRSLNVTGLTEMLFLNCSDNFIAAPDGIIGWHELGMQMNSVDDLYSGTLWFYNQRIGETSVLFTDCDGIVLEELTSPEFVTKMIRHNNSEQIEELTMIVAVYTSDGRLVCLGIDTKEISAGQSDEFVVRLDISGNVDGGFVPIEYYANVFLWDTNTFTPVTGKYIFK